MQTFPVIPWLQDWKREVDSTAQREYVRRELVRVAAAGAPVLSMVLALGEHMQKQKDIAMSLLHARALGSHRFLFRLAPGTKPPMRDAEGNDLPDDERGRVLYAKLGTKGGQVQGVQLADNVVSEFTGSAMQSRASMPSHDLASKQNYLYAKVGREPTDLSLDDAVKVLVRYGYGLVPNRYHGRSKRRDEKGNPIERDALGQPVQEIDFWLVEEIPPSMVNNDGTVKSPQPAQQNPKRAA